jgi:lactoylglutathione lyase
MTILNLIVLRSPRLDVVKSFYEAVGLRFASEKHGRGPHHFSSMSGAVVLELYPSGKEADVSDLRLGFGVSSLADVRGKADFPRRGCPRSGSGRAGRE